MSREMKDSGVEWIGEIPKDWDKIKIKYVYEIKKAKLPTEFFYDNKLIPYMSMEYIRDSSIVPQYAKDGDFCKKDDLLLLWDGSNAGEIIFDHPEGYAPSTTAILRLKKDINKSFAKYYLKFLEEELRNNTNGMGVPHVNGEFLKNANLLIPIEKEQQKIADFLDEKVGEIDRLIDNAKKSIEEYKKYKQSVITEAVTKGLNPNLEMKDSGIEWIGEISKNSHVGKIKFFVSKVGSGKTPKGGSEIYLNEGILFLRSQNIYDEGLNLDSPMYISKEIDEEMSNTRVLYNDVLLNITGGSIGRCCIYKERYRNANVNQHVSIIRVKEKLMLPKFMHYYWMSLLGKMVINLYQTGGNREGMSAEAIKNSPIVIFSISEQIEIINYLDDRCLEIDNLILKKEKLILELESYKKSLIYEYVTGKKEVKK